MKNITVAILILSAFGTITIAQQTIRSQVRTISKFEYKIVRSEESHPVEEKQLNQLGDEGWELIQVHPSAINWRSDKNIYVFKRLK